MKTTKTIVTEERIRYDDVEGYDNQVGFEVIVTFNNTGYYSKPRWVAKERLAAGSVRELWVVLREDCDRKMADHLGSEGQS